MDGYRHQLSTATAPPLSNKVVRSIGAVIRRVDGLRELWDECSLDHILSRYYDTEILGLSQDTATVAVIEGLSSVGPTDAAATAAVAVIEKLAERGIRPSVALGNGGSTSALPPAAAAMQRSFYQTLTETTDFALDHPFPGIGGRMSSHGNRLRTMSDVPLHATSNDLHHFTTSMPTAMLMSATTTTEGGTQVSTAGGSATRNLRRDSPSAVNVPQIDLDDLLSPPGTRQKASSALRNAVRGDLIGRVRQRVVNHETGRQRSRSEMDARWLKGLSAPASQSLGLQANAASPTKSGNPTDLRPDWMRSPQYLRSIEAKLDDPCLYYVEWNILGLQRALAMKKLTRVVSPRFALNPNPQLMVPTPSSLLLMISFCPRSCPASPLYVSISVSLPGEVEAKYRVFHPSYLSESRWHSFCQTPWATSENVRLPNPLPDVLTVGVVIEAIRPASSAKCQTPPVVNTTTTIENGPESLTSCPTSDVIASSNLAAGAKPPPRKGSGGYNVLSTPSVAAPDKIESLPSLTDLINLAATTYSTLSPGGAAPQTGGGATQSSALVSGSSPAPPTNPSGAMLFLSTPPTSGSPQELVVASPLTIDIVEAPGGPDEAGPSQEYEERRLFELLRNQLFDAEDDFMSDDGGKGERSTTEELVEANGA